jgi:glycosyltransferase involved in cell wall biosynthesis
VVAKAVPPLVYELLELGYNAYAFFRLGLHMLRRRPGLVYERYSLFTVAGLAAARLFRVPFILEVNAPLAWEKAEHGRLFLQSLAARIERFVCARADHTIVVSSVLGEMLAREGVPRERLVLMPNGIDPAEFHPRVDGRHVRQRHGIPEGAPVAGVIGWFRPWHGLDALIQACADHQLFEERNLFLLLVGDGPAVADARRLAERLGWAGRVIITGAVPRAEIPAYGAAMDVAVQPRVTAYACPMKIIEYLGLGRSIVAPDQPNIRDLLEDGRNALLFRPEDYSSLADAIERLLVDDTLKARLAQGAVATVGERDLTWTGNARRVVDLATAAGR